MTEGPWGGQDSRPAENPGPDDGAPGVPAPHGDVYTWYQRGLELLGRGSPAAAAQLLERAAEAEPGSRSVLEALGRAQFDTRRYDEAAATFRRIVEASPSDDYAHFGLGLALARGGNPARRGRAPGAGRRDAARAEALHRRAAGCAGHAPGPGPGGRGTARRPRLTPRREPPGRGDGPRWLALVLI